MSTKLSTYSVSEKKGIRRTLFVLPGLCVRCSDRPVWVDHTQKKAADGKVITHWWFPGNQPFPCCPPQAPRYQRPAMGVCFLSLPPVAARLLEARAAPVCSPSMPGIGNVRRYYGGGGWGSFSLCPPANRQASWGGKTCQRVISVGSLAASCSRLCTGEQ